MFGLRRSATISKICSEKNGDNSNRHHNFSMITKFSKLLLQSKRLAKYCNINIPPEEYSFLEALEHILQVERVTKSNPSNALIILNIEYCLHAIRLTKIVYKLMINLKQENFDTYTPERVHQLEQIWSHLKPNEKRPQLIASEWGQLGFQGKDPATDFRATGILGLTQLVYFATRKTESAKLILAESFDPKHSYFPFAVTGINITQFLMELFTEFRLHRVIFDHYSRTEIRNSDSSEDYDCINHFYELMNDLYCMIFEEFYLLWIVRNPTDIMSFSIIFEELQHNIREKYPIL
eukprot:gene4975-6958_t